jgi:hypothetical protein
VALKRLISHFTYRIEPKPEGGFVAHASEPSLPALEAPTQEELQQKIQAAIQASVTAEFPWLKLPPEAKTAGFAFHIEHTPGGGFTIQSTDGKALPIVGATHADIEKDFAEKIAGALGRQLPPELTQEIENRLGSGALDVRVKSSWSVTKSSGEGSNNQITLFLVVVAVIVGVMYWYLSR